MKATHTDYKHPRHLRVETGEGVLCVSPSASDYAKLNRPNLPEWNPLPDTPDNRAYLAAKAALSK